MHILATYGSPSNIPVVLAGKCEESACSTLTINLDAARTDIDVIKACFDDPTDATNCRG